MGTTERRLEILKDLCRYRHATILNLSFKFGVSPRTIQRDINFLSLTVPIYTTRGRYGGIHMLDNYQFERMYMNDKQLQVLHKLLTISQTSEILTVEEETILQSIISEYSKPKSKGTGETYDNK